MTMNLKTPVENRVLTVLGHLEGGGTLQEGQSCGITPCLADSPTPQGSWRKNTAGFGGKLSNLVGF